MNIRSFIPLVLGLGIGVFAIKMFMDVLKKAEGANNTETVQVVQAKTEIGATMRIGKGMVTLTEVPKPIAPSNAFVDAKEVIDRVTNKTIPQGMPILKSMLAPVGTPPGMTSKIPEGYRAVAVKVNEYVGVAGWIKPGSYVDVVVVMDRRDNTTNRRFTISKVVLQNVQVLAVGQEIQSSGDVGPSLARSVTLLVTPSDVPKLHLAETKGDVRLAMRGQEDQILKATNTTTDGALFDDLRPKKADKNAGSAALSLLGKLFQNPPKPQPQKTDKPDKAAQPPAPKDWSVEMVKGKEVYEIHFQTDEKGARRVEKNAGKHGATKRVSPGPVSSAPDGPGILGTKNSEVSKQLASKLPE
jgi:pilus assembly protein CpaB